MWRSSGLRLCRLSGDVLRYTVSPPLERVASAHSYRRNCSRPADVDPAFAAELPMAIRPWQIRANAEDTALMVPSAGAPNELPKSQGCYE